MFEKKLKEVSGFFDKSFGKKKFYILTHKKHKREIYFQNNQQAIRFLKVKFDSPLKKIAYFFIKIGLIQRFLKNIWLSSDLGDVVFVGGQIKAFDLRKRVVHSFIFNQEEKKDFLKSKEIQKELAEKDFAPKVLEVDSKVPYSKEELLDAKKNYDYVKVFRKLRDFYKIHGIAKIPVKKYADFLVRELEKNDIQDEFFIKVLEKISKKEISLLMSRVHGEFSREQILSKEDSYVFTDWDAYEKKLKKNLITRDLSSFLDFKIIKPLK